MHSQMSPQDFAALAASALIHNGAPAESVFYDDSQFDLLIKDGRGRVSGTIHLNNFYLRFKATEDFTQHRRIIRQIAAYATPEPVAESLNEVVDRLRIQVRCRADVPSEIPRYPFGDHLAAFIVYDQPDTFHWVSQSDLQRWGVDFDTAFDMGFAKLSQLGPMQWQTDDAESYWHFESDDNLAAGRAVFISVMEQLPVNGDRIVALLSRDHIMVTGSESFDGLSTILGAMHEVKDQSGALPPILLRLQKDLYKHYRLPQEHPLYRDFLHLELEYFSELYRVQGEELGGQFDQLVGGQTVIRHAVNLENTIPYSACAIGPELLPCLLPKVDYVILGDHERPQAIAAWNTFEQILGDRLQDTGLYPARFRLTSFPSAAELQSIGFEPLPQ